MAYLPSKKFIIVALAVLLAGVGGFWFYKKGGIENNPLFPRDKSSLSLNFGQGEKNWEKVLWEIASSSPNINPKIFAAKDSSEETGGLTKTDALARDFFANFLALQQSGNLNQENKDKLTESFLAGISQEKLPDQYKPSDIKIINDNSKETVKLYGNKLEKIFNSHIVPENELIIFERALKNQDEKEIQKLGPIATTYYKASQEILAIETPSSISELHLNLINNFFNIAKCIEKMETAFQDPINAITGLKLYQGNIQSSYNILKELKNQGILNNL